MQLTLIPQSILIFPHNRKFSLVLFSLSIFYGKLILIVVFGIFYLTYNDNKIHSINIFDHNGKLLEKIDNNKDQTIIDLQKQYATDLDAID